MAKLKIGIDGEEVELEVTRQGNNFRVTRNGKTVDLHLLHTDGRHFLLEQLAEDGKRQRIRAAGHADGDNRYMWVNGRSFSYRKIQNHKRATVDDDNTRLSASIPAVVADILVNEGDTVSDGDKLILLESMKMVIPIPAQFAGTIRSINCAIGDAVQPGIPLLEMEPITEEA